MPLDSGLGSSMDQLVICDVDLDAPCNMHPVASLEDTELLSLVTLGKDFAAAASSSTTPTSSSSSSSSSSSHLYFQITTNCFQSFCESRKKKAASLTLG